MTNNQCQKARSFEGKTVRQKEKKPLQLNSRARWFCRESSHLDRGTKTYNFRLHPKWSVVNKPMKYYEISQLCRVCPIYSRDWALPNIQIQHPQSIRRSAQGDREKLKQLLREDETWPGVKKIGDGRGLWVGIMPILTGMYRDNLW